MVPSCCSGKEEKQKTDTTQQDDSAEVLKTINKHLQEPSTIFSEKLKKKKVKMRSLVRCLLPNWKAFPVLFWRLSLNRRWIISFSSIECLIYNNPQPNPPIQSLPSTFQLTTPPSQNNGMKNYDTSMSSNQWNS